MFRTRLYRDGTCREEDFDPARISDFLEHDDRSVVWLDVCDPEPGDLALIAEEFSLNPLAVEDATHAHQRPKLDHYDDHVFLSLYDVALDTVTGELRTSELAVFAAPRYLITVRKTGDFSMDRVVASWDREHGVAKHGVGYLLHGLLDVVVDGHFDTVQTLDAEIDALEDMLFEDRPHDRVVQRRSFELRKSIVMLRRVVLPTREVLNALMRREAGIVDDAMLPYFQDVYDHVLRATDWTDSLRDLVSTILETNLTIQGNRLNTIMKKVTSWAAIIAVPTAVTGFYGMNVPYPGFARHAGFLSSVALLVGLSIALYVVFRTRDWL